MAVSLRLLAWVLVGLAALGLVMGIGSYLVYTRGGGYCPASHNRVGEESGGSGALVLPGEIESGGVRSHSGCESLYHIPEAKLFGVHYSVWAPLFFSVTLVLSVLFAVGLVAWLWVPLVVLYGVGLVLVPWLVHLEVKTGVFCPYCTVMHIVIVSSFIILLYIVLRYERR